MEYGVALCLTMLVEVAVVLVWCRSRRPLDIALIVVLVVGLNLVSHPIAWIAYGAVPLPPVTAFIGTELAVIVFESMVLSLIPGVNPGTAAWIAFAMNATSSSVGLLVL